MSKRAASCRRNSTNKTYNNRPRLYFDRAKEQHIDALQASELQRADFLEFLFTVKNLQARSIAGYKSAAVHPGWDGVGVGQTKSLEKLLRAYFIALPPKRRLVPTWDIGFVLQALFKHSFEPLGQVDLKFLTFKTLFLVAAASGRRVSCLHALVVNEGHIRWDRDSVSIIPSPEFLAKNDFLNYMTNKITLPKCQHFLQLEKMTYFVQHVP